MMMMTTMTNLRGRPKKYSARPHSVSAVRARRKRQHAPWRTAS
jgi:hypothetical protein